MIVAIHQPNYLPWLGYFFKAARADVFVFLDDAQYTKNSYINRVEVLDSGKRRWLTVPVKVHLGDAIDAVRPANDDWPGRHVDTLRNAYRGAKHAAATLGWLTPLLAAVPPSADLATINQGLIRGVAELLGVRCRFVSASALSVSKDLRREDRLIALVQAVAPDAEYLSGSGGAGYQDESKFAAAGIRLRYSSFQHPTYLQQSPTFESGLSILDILFHGGVDAAIGALG